MEHLTIAPKCSGTYSDGQWHTSILQWEIQCSNSKPSFLEDTLPSLPGQVPPSSELTCYLMHSFISAISKPLVFSLPKSQHFGKLLSWQGWKWWMYKTQGFTCDGEWEIMSSMTESRLGYDNKDWHQKTQLRVFKVWDTDMWTHFAFSTCP